MIYISTFLARPHSESTYAFVLPLVQPPNLLKLTLEHHLPSFASHSGLTTIILHPKNDCQSISLKLEDVLLDHHQTFERYKQYICTKI